MIRSHIMRLSMWSSEGVADLPILWIPQFSYHLTINVVRSPKVRGVGDNLLIFWCSTGDILVHHIMGGSFFCFFWGDKILTAVFFFRRTHDEPKQGSNTKNERHSNQDTPAPGTFFYWTRWWFHQEDLRFEVRMLWQIPPFPVPL